MQAAQPQASQSPWNRKLYDQTVFHLLQNPRLSFWEGREVERIGKGESKRETDNNFKKETGQNLVTLESAEISAWQVTKAKRQVLGWVNFRLNICPSLGKLINPLWF